MNPRLLNKHRYICKQHNIEIAITIFPIQNCLASLPVIVANPVYSSGNLVSSHPIFVCLFVCYGSPKPHLKFWQGARLMNSLRVHTTVRRNLFRQVVKSNFQKDNTGDDDCAWRKAINEKPFVWFRVDFIPYILVQSGPYATKPIPWGCVLFSRVVLVQPTKKILKNLNVVLKWSDHS